MHKLTVALMLLGTVAFSDTVKGKVQVSGARSPENSVVFIALVPGKVFAPPTQTAVMDQKGKAFVPHVLVVQKGQHVVFPNTDVVRHNVFSPSKAHKFNLGIFPPGVVKDELFDQAGVVSLLCNVHPEMSGFIVVSETPWFAVVGPDGTYQLKDVPPGRYQVTAWHEGFPPVTEPVDVKGDASANFTITKG